MKLDIEAKREREEDDDGERLTLKRQMTGDRNDAWYEQMFARFQTQLQHVQYGLAGFINSLEKFKSMARFTDMAIYIDTFAEDVIGDLSFLALFPHATNLVINEEVGMPERSSADSEYSESEIMFDDLVPLVLRSTGLDETPITTLHLKTDMYSITDISRPFAQSLGKVVTLNLECPLELLLDDITDPPAFDLHSLTTMYLGNADVDIPMMRHVQSIVQPNYFGVIDTLKTLEVHNCAKVASMALERISPNLTSLEIYLCKLSSIPTTWAPHMTRLESLTFRNTSIHSIDVAQFQPFASLRELTVANTTASYEERERDLNYPHLNNLSNGVVLHNLPNLQRLSFLDVELSHLQLGIDVPSLAEDAEDGADADAQNMPFRSLRGLYLEPGANISIATRHFPSTFLPHLEIVQLTKDDTWPERRHEVEPWAPRNWFTHAGIFFPPWLLGVPALNSYTGPVKWQLRPTAPTPALVNIDAYMDPWSFTFSPGYADMLKRVLRRNRNSVNFRSNNAPLHRLIEATYAEIANELTLDPDDVQRAARAEETRAERQRALDAEREQNERLFATWQEHLDRSGTSPDVLPLHQWIMQHTRAAARRTTLPYRADPYYVRYDPAIECADDRAVPDPFAPFGDPRRPQHHTCDLCGQQFSRATHDANPAPVVDNSDLDRRNELELAMQAGERAVDDAADDVTARLGCVVVCNVLESDFDANHLSVPAGASHADAVHRLQCDHYRHFFHRVCYGIALYETYVKDRNFRCPRVRTLHFYPRPNEDIE